MDALTQFRNTIHAAGLTPPDTIEPDVKLHRFATNGKRGDDSGWYVLHVDGVPAGVFGDWRTDLSQMWHADVGRKLSPEETAAHRARLDAIRSDRDAEGARLRLASRR